MRAQVVGRGGMGGGEGKLGGQEKKTACAFLPCADFSRNLGILFGNFLFKHFQYY